MTRHCQTLSGRLQLRAEFQANVSSSVPFFLSVSIFTSVVGSSIIQRAVTIPFMKHWVIEDNKRTWFPTKANSCFRLSCNPKHIRSERTIWIQGTTTRQEPTRENLTSGSREVTPFVVFSNDSQPRVELSITCLVFQHGGVRKGVADLGCFTFVFLRIYQTCFIKR